jgi:hypothetical protein
MVTEPLGTPLRHAGASIGWQRLFSDVRQALGVPGVEPHAAREPKDVAEGAAMAANFRNVRRLVISMNFIDHSANSCLLV